MKFKIFGIDLTLSSTEGALWWDADKRYIAKDTKKGFGIMASVKVGWFMRPIGKIWKKEFWKRDSGYNSWASGNIWFVIPPIPCIGPFISIAYNDYGFYLGFKEYDLDSPRNKSWCKDEYMGNNGKALAFSATIRRTRG